MAAITLDEHLKILVDELRKLRWSHYQTMKSLCNATELDRNAILQMGDTLRQLLTLTELIVTSRL